MNIAYLAVTHKNPKLLKKEIEALSYGNCEFFIHLDSKSDLSEFSDIQGKNIHFISRIPVYWGDYSVVEAILSLLRYAVRASTKFDYCVLLSGSEYPLTSAGEVHSFLQQNQGAEYISLTRVPNAEAGQSLARFNRLVLSHERSAMIRLGTRALAKLGLAQRDYRRYLGDLNPYSGSTWWALTNEACSYILDFMERNPYLAQFFKDTFAPDECLVHTILGNSRFAIRARRNLVYEDWSDSAASPAMLNDRHVAFFETFGGMVIGHNVYGSGELLFARKFSDESLDLIGRIDDMMARKKNLCNPGK